MRARGERCTVGAGRGVGRAGEEAARCEPGRSEGGRSWAECCWAAVGRKRAEGKGRAVSEERVGWAQEKGEVR